MKLLLPLLLAPLAFALPARADFATSCRNIGPEACAGVVVAASVCYDKAHPGENSSSIAAGMLSRMGITRAHVTSQVAARVAREQVLIHCP